MWPYKVVLVKVQGDRHGANSSDRSGLLTLSKRPTILSK